MSNYTIINGQLHDSDELIHYGVRGMKWGVRRYRDANGKLTADGRKRARQEYREDNKRAFELGKDATLTGHAAAKSMKRTIKLENKLEKKYEKDPEATSRSTQRLRKKWNASAETTAQLAKHYADAQAKAEKHCNSLIDKYGAEAVSSIRYKDIKLPTGKYSPSKFRTINEDTNSLDTYAVNAGISVVSTALNIIGVTPVAVISVPRTAAEKARRIEMDAYHTNLRNQRNNAQ